MQIEELLAHLELQRIVDTRSKRGLPSDRLLLLCQLGAVALLPC